MDYEEKIVTHEILKKDILCYWQMKANIDMSTGIQSRYLPKGQNLLVFNYGSEIGYADSPKVQFLDSKFFIVPAFSSSRLIHQKGETYLFGISFIGDGLYKLGQHPITKMANKLPQELWQTLEDLHTKLKELSFSEKTVYAEKFLIKNLNQNLNSPPFHQAIKYIEQKKGVTTVLDIANNSCVSERQLQRLFKARIGISPKDYCKIIRVNNYIDYILNKNKRVDWMELVVAYNYHDQPHLINEVKSIANLSPRKLQSYRDTLYHRYIGD